MEISEEMRNELLKVQAPSMCALVTLETILEHQKWELPPYVFNAIITTILDAVNERLTNLMVTED